MKVLKALLLVLFLPLAVIKAILYYVVAVPYLWLLQQLFRIKEPITDF